ncbi:hypothetical protein PAXRUDRAFT_143680 [Paxillus rubicundulus Ve08.2h10]|uniref:EVE domain-containing protein n=1 Tax=Paxillus rubicundulus Ve08.2h10 TaxID=930991 RepID=A0A0D0E1D3_9AGAM|nr:hypothetical protein PAXRUDRAFT_143680 [Paxillus rubicundulus Ve08.2h10]
MEGRSTNYWLMKAEPDSRVVKGKDVKACFSVDDFESARSTPWEGVRNYEARNLMKEMAVGDKILFYHSNCKNPGIAGFAKVSREAYPDYTAWDSAHPYYDEKADKDNPKWFMVDAEFVCRARHFIPLSLLRYIADLPSSEPPEEIGYVGTAGVKAIQAMPLVTRGRLSVQRVSEEGWGIIEMMAEKGGWENIPFMKKKVTNARQPAEKTKTAAARKVRKKKVPTKEEDDKSVDEDLKGDAAQERKQESEAFNPPKKGRKRKVLDATAQEDDAQNLATRRKSMRFQR